MTYARIKMQLLPQVQEILEVGDTAVKEVVMAAVETFIDKNCD